jgi:hypothetical protein
MKTFKITILFAILIFMCANVYGQNLEGKYYLLARVCNACDVSPYL